MNRLYTEKDIKNAGRVGRSFVSFQWIEGQGAINECYGDCSKIMSYCVDMFAGLLLRTDLTTSPEVTVEDIKQKILSQYYLHKNEIENGNEKFDSRS